MFVMAREIEILLRHAISIYKVYIWEQICVNFLFIISTPDKNKQLLDEAEHDIKNYSDRGQN